MGLKDMAMDASVEAERHAAEMERLRRAKLREDFTREAREWLTSVFTRPDELVVEENQHLPMGHVRFDDLWFSVHRIRANRQEQERADRDGRSISPFELHPVEPCPSREGRWHHVDASLFGLGSHNHLDNLTKLGEYLRRTEGGTKGPSVGRCRDCEQAMGTVPDAHGTKWVGFAAKIGDLPRMAAEQGIKKQPVRT